MFQRATRSYDELQSALYGDPQLSRQNQKPHGKNKIPHGKTKYFRAKTKYLTAKANTHGKTKAILLLL